MSTVLAIDQGTTSTRAIVLDGALRVRGVGQQAFTQHFPRDGWVEHDPADLWRTTRATIATALAAAGITARQLAGIGITNQRETTLVWERASGRPIAPAIVWQDRRTADACARLKAEGVEADVTLRTGLLLDPYFSATKLAWLLDTVPGAREQARDGKLAFGTVDTWLLWNLTGGRVHATDVTNASRTLLYNIATLDWDDELLGLFDIPRALLPQVRECAAPFGVTAPGVLDAEVAILGIAGDQQAATIGQACFSPGMMKATFGTGCFALLNTGAERVASRNRLLTTIAYRLDGRVAYALEGSIFIAGAAVQWLRDGLGILASADQSGPLALAADPTQRVVMVPAFTGLGAPHWDSEARGAIFGLTRNSGPKELARAALESVCFQMADLLAAMRADWPALTEPVLRVDGGMTASDTTMQWLADIVGTPVERPHVLETTALGAAWLAGRQAGVWPEPAEMAARWTPERRFVPAIGADERAHKLAGWHDAVRRTLTR